MIMDGEGSHNSPYLVILDSGSRYKTSGSEMQIYHSGQKE